MSMCTGDTLAEFTGYIGHSTQSNADADAFGNFTTYATR